MSMRCALGEGIIHEEVWRDSRGAVVKYNLTFINHCLCDRDNSSSGRVIVISIHWKLSPDF